MIGLDDFRRRADEVDAMGAEATAAEMRAAADEIEVCRRGGPVMFLFLYRATLSCTDPTTGAQTVVQAGLWLSEADATQQVRRVAETLQRSPEWVGAAITGSTVALLLASTLVAESLNAAISDVLRNVEERDAMRDTLDPRLRTRLCITGEPWPVHVYDHAGTMLCGAVQSGTMIEGSPDTFRRYPTDDRCAGCAESLGRREGLDDGVSEILRGRATVARLTRELDDLAEYRAAQRDRV